jgi:hypothetical protein
MSREERYRKALEEIRDTQGYVCDNYELCTHKSCGSSYAAWCIADMALRDDPAPRDTSHDTELFMETVFDGNVV